ncbi:MAG TPA: hypothetical protein VN639_04260 [Azonexus sp.]|nr:hypothetical protein [Azonexus sp.]
MTVIAAFNVQGCPIVFGDLLTTAETEPGDRIVAVPALGDVRDFFEGSGWTITGLAQKVVIISQSCVVAWAGSWIAAKLVISQLRKMSSDTTLTADGILSFLQQHPDLQQHPISLTGWVREERGLKPFWYQAEDVFDGGKLGIVSTAGSGAHALREFAEIVGQSPFATTGQANAGEMAVSTALFLAGVLLRAELHGGDAAPTLRCMFGGGYEIASYLNGEFRKVGDLTFVVWEAQVNDEGVKISLPQLLLKQQYLHDVLLLRSARVKENSGHLEVFDEQYHAVLPMYEVGKEILAEDLLNVSLQSRLLCHCFLVRSDDDVAIYTRVQQCAPSSELTMTMKDDSGKIVLGFNNAFLQEVGKELINKGHNSKK